MEIGLAEAINLPSGCDPFQPIFKRFSFHTLRVDQKSAQDSGFQLSSFVTMVELATR
jgi:hypothetical protein